MRGFIRAGILDVRTVLLLVRSLGALLAPFCAPLYWSRWMLMLVYPFTFYATNGLEKILEGEVNPRRIWSTLSRAVVIATILMGVLFMALPANVVIFGIPTLTSYARPACSRTPYPYRTLREP